VVEVKNLTKRFDRVAALDDVSFSVTPGSIFGVVGPHRAGKSTLLRILATMLQPTSGDAYIAGASVTGDRLRVRQLVGYLPDSFGVYPDMTCAEYVEFFAACFGVPPSERSALARDLLQLVDLYHRRNDQADRLTRSMRQRLGLARVLAHDPQVLLLDEPALYLDPRARVEMRELMRELSGMGKTIILTSPNLIELEDICTHAIAMHAGKITDWGSFEELQETVPLYRTISVKYLGDTNMAVNLIKSGKGIIEVQPVNTAIPGAESLGGVTLLKEIHVTFDGLYSDASALLRSLMHSGVQVVHFSELEE
jgi:ABC-2 type transport system ATP-binding protein